MTICRFTVQIGQYAAISLMYSHIQDIDFILRPLVDKSYIILVHIRHELVKLFFWLGPHEEDIINVTPQ